MSILLKPCPFCGDDYVYFLADNNDLTPDGSGCVHCDVCETEGPFAYSEEEAVDGWNQRMEREDKEVHDEA